jgi:hypothetical protein
LKDLLERTGFKVLNIYRYSIVPQLLVIKILSAIKGLLFKSDKRGVYSGNSGREKNTSGDISQTSLRDSNINKVVRIVWNYFDYLLRYKIGYIVPKEYQPQTVIVVAQKEKQSDSWTIAS